MSDKLSELQADLLEFVSEHQSKKGYGPTFEELSEALDVNWTKARSEALDLVEEGYLGREAGVPRSLHLKDPPSTTT